MPNFLKALQVGSLSAAALALSAQLVAAPPMEHEGSGYIESGTTETPPSHRDMGGRNHEDFPEGITYEDWNEESDVYDMYESWDEDGDGVLSEDEYSAGLFNAYDRNEDGTWSDEEYQRWQDDAGDEGFWEV